MTDLYIDIETRSRVDLKRLGVYPYVRCPDFRILIASWAFDDEPVTTAFGHNEIASIPDLFNPRVRKVAHNAPFERVCLTTLSDLPEGTFLSPKEFRDTQAIAAEHGFPKGLGNLARVVGGEQKDEAGTRLINLFCKPNRKGEWNDHTTHPEEWMDFVAYCEQDVETLRDIDRFLGGESGWPNKMEKRIFLVDQDINDRGIAIDTRLAEEAVRAGAQNAEEQLARVRELSGVDNPNSVQQMSGWLRREGIKAPNMRAETVEKLLEGDLTAEQREVLELRQELALAAPKKFQSALAAVAPDGRLRGTLAFFGAHTGRWAGRGTQVQNLPRHSFELEADAELAIHDLYSGERVSSDDLKRLVRPMFGDPEVGLTVVDYSAIEARILAGLAGEEWALAAFRRGRDIYVETAERMSTPGNTLDRSQGKVAVLALGYNGGIPSLRAMGAQGTDEELKRLVVQWRKANSKITRLWQELGDAFGEEDTQVGSFLRVVEGEDRMGRSVTIHLPSGRHIKYHGVKWERYSVRDPKTDRMVRKEGWRYADPTRPFNFNSRIGTYGGRLAENVTQAVARDIMAEALVRLSERGYRPVGHVHDEILVEGQHDVEEIASIMSEVPSWAEGFPIDGEGFTCRRYKKG